MVMRVWVSDGWPGVRVLGLGVISSPARELGDRVYKLSFRHRVEVMPTGPFLRSAWGRGLGAPQCFEVPAGTKPWCCGLVPRGQREGVRAESPPVSDPHQ